MSDRTYGTDAWTMDELEEQFLIPYDEGMDLGRLKGMNARLAKLHHLATFQLSRAARAHALAKKVIDSQRDDLVEEMTAEELSKTSGSRMTVDQRNSKINKKLANMKDALVECEDEVDQWNRVIEHLKYVAKRVDGAIIVESVEAKMSPNT